MTVPLYCMGLMALVPIVVDIPRDLVLVFFILYTAAAVVLVMSMKCCPVKPESSMFTGTRLSTHRGSIPINMRA